MDNLFLLFLNQSETRAKNRIGEEPLKKAKTIPTLATQLGSVLDGVAAHVEALGDVRSGDPVWHSRQPLPPLALGAVVRVVEVYRGSDQIATSLG